MEPVQIKTLLIHIRKIKIDMFRMTQYKLYSSRTEFESVASPTCRTELQCTRNVADSSLYKVSYKYTYQQHLLT